VSNRKPIIEGEEELVLEAKTRHRNATRQRVEDLKSVMSLPHGRRFVWSILETTGLFRTSFTGNAATYFNEGMRNVGLKVVGDLSEHCPELYLLMQQEQLKGERDE
jgi:hypothetical protein